MTACKFIWRIRPCDTAPLTLHLSDTQNPTEKIGERLSPAMISHSIFPHGPLELPRRGLGRGKIDARGMVAPGNGQRGPG